MQSQTGFSFEGLRHEVDVKSGVALAEKLAFKDKDITLCTKAPEEHQGRKKVFLWFWLKKSFRVFRHFRCLRNTKNICDFREFCETMKN